MNRQIAGVRGQGLGVKRWRGVSGSRFAPLGSWLVLLLCLLVPTTAGAENRILSLSPDTGPVIGGTVVKITLEDLSVLGDLEVRFSDRVATMVRRLGGGTLEVRTPPGNPGPVEVRVVNEFWGTVTSPAVFTYLPVGTPRSSAVTPQPIRADPAAVQVGSGEVRIQVENPTPRITALEVSSPSRGGLAGTLLVRGKGFRPESVILIADTRVETAFRSEEELVGTIPPQLFETPATLAVTVSTPGPGGGTSNAGKLVVEVPPVVGRYVAFTSNRHEGRNHLFLFDRATNRLDPLEEANGPNANDAYPSISADGRFIVFQSDRHGGQYDIFLFDRQTRTLDPLPEANHPTAFDGFPKISADGRLIVFESDRLNGRPKIFLFDRKTRTLSELSRANEATADDGLAAISN